MLTVKKEKAEKTTHHARLACTGNPPSAKVCGVSLFATVGQSGRGGGRGETHKAPPSAVGVPG